MKPRSMLLLLVAGGCGLVASVAVTQHLAGNQTDPATPPGEPAKRVVVAKSDQEAGTQLNQEMLEVVERPAKYLPEGIFSDLAEVTGQTLRLPVFKGEYVLAGKLGGDKSLAILKSKLPPGMRLGEVRIPANEAPGAGLINPGDRVDVFWKPTSIVPGGVKTVPGVVKPLMQNIQVLAVGQRVTRSDSDLGTSNERKGGDQNYTLLVTDEEDLRLMAASAAGVMRLRLRGPSDTSLKPLDVDALDILLGLKAAPQPVVQEAPVPAPAPPEPEKYEIEIINGNLSTTVEIDNPQPLRIRGNK